MAHLVPMVLQRTSQGERSMDLFSRLLEDRVIYMTGEVNDQMAELISAQLLYLENANKGKDISMYIHSPGGSISAGMVIYNTMKFITSDVSTVVTGMAASMGSFIAACGGTKGKRFMLSEAENMCHQPSGGAQGQSDNIVIAANHIVRLRNRLEAIYAESTGLSVETIHDMCDRDKWMTAQEALELGFCDEILKGSK